MRREETVYTSSNIGEETCINRQRDFAVGKFRVVSYAEDEECWCIERFGSIDIDIIPSQEIHE